MPQIIVTAGHAAREEGATVLLRERINVSDFESERFAANLVERLGWAVVDATEAEEQPTPPEPEPEPELEPAAHRERELAPVGSA